MQTQWNKSFFTLLVSDADFLAFINLRSTAGVTKKDLPPADDTTSSDIDIPFGLVFDNASQTTVYVSWPVLNT